MAFRFSGAQFSGWWSRWATVRITFPFAHFAGSPCCSTQRLGPGVVRCRPHSPWHSQRPPERSRMAALMRFQSFG